MKDNVSYARSSMMVSDPVLVVCPVLSVLAAFFGQRNMALVLMFFFGVALVSRAWARASAKNITVNLSRVEQGIFQGEEMDIEIEVRNEKFLPVVWLDLFFPLAWNLCVVPEDCRRPDDWEITSLRETGASELLVGEKRFSFLLWYETKRYASRWKGRKRGIYSLKGWRLCTGDGFGLTQVERYLPEPMVRQIAVYPRLVQVLPDLFLRNLWNADTGARGVIEDPTVIRSTRDYMTSDALKHINWRLAARGLPLTVNIYEDILPKGVHFLFDGESFSGPAPHLEEMEDALSVLASEVLRLSEHQVRCGLSLCKGRENEAVNIFGAEQIEELFCALASYQPLPDEREKETNKVVAQRPIFLEGAIYEAAQSVGRFYYVAYDCACLRDRDLLKRLEQGSTTILTYQEPEAYGEFEMVCLRRLKEERDNES